MIQSYEIDLLEDIPISMNFAVQDIRMPGQRDTSFTKTITLPGTNRNNEIFSKVYDLGYFIQTTGTTQYEEGDFNPNLKTNAVIYIDNIPQFRGYLKLDKVVRDDWDKITYECTIYGKLKSFWGEMGDKKLTELDFSSYNHTYTTNQITGSWTPVLGQAYCYPMINWGNGTMTNTQVEWWKPALFLKEYVDKIFMSNGYQYSSAFFDSTYFKSLVVPCAADRMRLSYNSVALTEMRASRSSTQTIAATFNAANQIGYGRTILFDDDSTTPNSDAGNQYTPVSGVYTSTNKRRLNINAVLDLRYLFSPSSPATSNCRIDVQARILKFDSAGNTQTYGGGKAQLTFNFAQQGLINNGDRTATGRINISANNILVKAGEKILIDVWQVNKKITPLQPLTPLYNAGVGGTLDLEVLNTSYFEIKVADSALQAGDTVEMSQAVPEDFRQADLMADIIKTFNLYIEEDKLTPNKLIIEPFVDYYSSGVTLDWSDKLDVSKPLEIIPMAMLEGRRYVYKFSDDNDYLNEFYKKKYNKTYGQKEVDITNDWNTQTVTIEPRFASTPLELTIGTDRVISGIYTLDNNNLPQTKSSKPRLLYWGGLKTTAFNFTINDTSTGVTNSFTQYPYAGHLDDTSTPDWDINFNFPREVFYNATAYTTGNLYNEYWKQYTEEITDVNSKVVVGYFFLTPSDIHQLDFRNKIFLHGQTYRLNRITDYNPVNSGLTKVELIKVKNGLKFSGRRKPSLNAGGSSSDDTNPAYSTLRLLAGNNNQSPNPINKISGIDNYIAYNTSGCTIEGGEGNSILGDCMNVNIVNSSGCTVLGGLTNVSIFNTSGLTITEDNISYMYNEVIPDQQKKIIYLEKEQYYIQLDEQLLINRYTSASVNWYLPSSGMSVGQEIVVKNDVNMGMNTCTLNGNGYTIDGSNTLVFTTQYISYTVRFTGGGWSII